MPEDIQLAGPRPEAGPHMKKMGVKRHGAAATAQVRMREQDTARIGILHSILAFEEGLRSPASIVELRYYFVNEIRKVLPCNQVIYQEYGGRTDRARIAAVSSLAVPDQNSPMVRWLNSALAASSRNKDEAAVRCFRLPATEAQGAPYPFPYAAQVQIMKPGGSRFGQLTLLSGRPFEADCTPVLERLGSAIGHALHPFARRRRAFALAFSRPLQWIVAILVAGAMFVPVPLTVLASVSVVAKDPVIVTAPLAGVIEKVHKKPDSNVEQGDPLFSYNSTELTNAHELAQRDVAVAQARLRRANQDAFSGGDGRRELAIAAAELDLAKAELDASGRRLAMVNVTAGRGGVLLFASVEEWTGRPVSTGERVMQIADPGSMRLNIELESGDSILLGKNARIRVFLDSAPLDPLEARLTRTSYEAVLSDRQVLVYPLTGELLGDLPKGLRIGQRGIAQLTGSKVPLWFFLFRRPLSFLRQRTGW